MGDLRRGEDGKPVPEGETVLRMGIPSMDFADRHKASPNWFELSTEDERRDQPRLSVFCEKLTTPEEAWRLLGSREEYSAVARLNVDEIRMIRPDPESQEVPNLDVVWDDEVDPGPGAEGHAGITGLDRRGAVTRLHTKSLRLQLADRAVVSLWREEAQ